MHQGFLPFNRAAELTLSALNLLSQLTSLVKCLCKEQGFQMDCKYIYGEHHKYVKSGLVLRWSLFARTEVSQVNGREPLKLTLHKPGARSRKSSSVRMRPLSIFPR